MTKSSKNQNGSANDPHKAFNVNAGSDRAKDLTKLAVKIGKPVPMKNLHLAAITYLARIGRERRLPFRVLRDGDKAMLKRA